MKNKIKNTKAITLIALIITIILLLILAGVTITVLTGENGLLNRVKNAKEITQNATINENTTLDSYSEMINQVGENGSNKDTIEELPDVTISTPAGTYVKITDSKWDSDTVYAVADGIGNVIPIPQEMYYVGGNVDTGVVISDNVTDENNGVGQAKDLVLVGNQFVWIPVTLKQLKYERYNFNMVGGTYSSYSEVLPDDEQLSINKYGGYYIARYEAGVEGYDASKTATSNSSSSTIWTGYQTAAGTDPTVVSKKEIQVWNLITRDKAIAIAEGMNIQNGTTKLCSSYAWDTTLKYIALTNSSYITNSTGGIYGVSAPAKTGSSISVNNIYDMGGNVWEWNTENYNGTGGTLRGGGYNYTSDVTPACYRTLYSSTSYHSYLGFRITLYM